ncbi:MAG: AbrB/MazE/SpoVT family DNA-binding domain-containing protein [Thermoplasmataceae archaeon]
MTKKCTISSKGQITLPKYLRKKYHLNEGESVQILDSGEGIFIKHGKETPRGILKGKMDIREFEKDVKALRKEWKM